MSSKITHYEKIAKVIEFIGDHFKEQPSLVELAEFANMSPFHFQRIFTEWVGISPKKYLQFLSVNYAKERLLDSDSLLNASMDTGFSSTSRLHDLFVNIEGMTPGEFKNGGLNLKISYNEFQSPFGSMVMASTSKGLCYMGFVKSLDEGIQDLMTMFPNASLSREIDQFQINALNVFNPDKDAQQELKLHLKCTKFQLKVWEALLTIPKGHLVSYGNIAKIIGKPNSSRAVGNAIGHNPIAILIPCHRVIQKSGIIGGYKWNSVRKKAIIGWEAAKQKQT